MTGYTNSDGSSLAGALNASTGAGQALKVDVSGNLLVSGAAGGISSVNIAQVSGAASSLSNPLFTANAIGGAAVSRDNPYPSADQIRLWIQNAQGFSCTTTKQTAAGAIIGGFGIWNPSGSGKLLVIYSLKLMIGNNSFNNLHYVTADPAFGTSMNIINRHAGGATASVAVVSFANTNQTPVGNANDTFAGASNTLIQVLQNGDTLFVPANNGIALYLNISGANSWSCSAQWVEI